MVLCKTSHVLTCFVLGYFGVLVHKWPTNLYALLASTLWFGVGPCLDIEVSGPLSILGVSVPPCLTCVFLVPCHHNFCFFGD